MLVAELGEKILRWYRSGKLVKGFPVSSGARRRSCVADSLGTPWGLHEISEKHGDGEPAGMVFKGRVATGRVWTELLGEESGEQSLVTTRILWLRGLEPGVNAGPGLETFERYIYIHGTNHPEKFPENISSGCLLMRDDDLIELYAAVDTGTHVWLGLP